MKKLLALVLALTMVFALVGCTENTAKDDPSKKSEGVMTYAEYAEAALESEVTIEAYVQAKQSWYDGAATFYVQDTDGAYFLYNMPCSEEDFAKIVEGTKLKVTGYKTEWAGEVEIIDATYEILDGKYVAEVQDVTDLLGTDELIEKQNMKAAFKGMTIEPSTDANGNEAAFLYAWDGSGAEGTDSDLYFNASVNGNTYTFVVEYWDCDANGVCGADTDVYKAVQGLNIGDTVDIEGFLYWYEGVQTHVSSVTVK